MFKFGLRCFSGEVEIAYLLRNSREQGRVLSEAGLQSRGPAEKWTLPSSYPGLCQGLHLEHLDKPDRNRAGTSSTFTWRNMEKRIQDLDQLRTSYCLENLGWTQMANLTQGLN